MTLESCFRVQVLTYYNELLFKRNLITQKERRQMDRLIRQTYADRRPDASSGPEAPYL